MILNPSNPRLTDEEFYERYSDTVDAMPGDYFLFASDDTEIHPELITRWNDDRMNNPAAGIWMVAQRTATGHRFVDMISFLNGELDNGQAIISTQFFRSLNLRYYAFGWERFLFRKMYEMAPDKFRFIYEPLALHDHQRI